MACAIPDLDYQNFPQVVEGLDDYERFYILTRLKDRLQAIFWVPVNAGKIKRTDLCDTLIKVIDQDVLKK